MDFILQNLVPPGSPLYVYLALSHGLQCSCLSHVHDTNQTDQSNRTTLSVIQLWYNMHAFDVPFMLVHLHGDLGQATEVYGTTEVLIGPTTLM